MKLQLKRSNVVESGSAKEPTAAQLEYGELAVNYNNGDPVIFMKDSSNAVVRIAGAGAPGGGGGAGLLGSAIVKGLAANNACPLILDTDKAKGEELKKEILNTKNEAYFYKADFSNPKELPKILENINVLKSIHTNICIGSSNKRFSSKLFDGIETKDDLKVANLATFAVSSLQGATYLRVHDVDITKDTIMIIDKVKNVS